MNQKQYITHGEALRIAKRIQKGEKLVDIAKEMGREYGPLNRYMNTYGLGVQQIKRQR